jgi:hypothetical protein
MSDDHDLARHRHLTGLAAALHGLRQRLDEVEQRMGAGEISHEEAMAEITEIEKLGAILDDCRD